MCPTLPGGRSGSWSPVETRSKKPHSHIASGPHRSPPRGGRTIRVRARPARGEYPQRVRADRDAVAVRHAEWNMRRDRTMRAADRMSAGRVVFSDFLDGAGAATGTWPSAVIERRRHCRPRRSHVRVTASRCGFDDPAGADECQIIWRLGIKPPADRKHREDGAERCDFHVKHQNGSQIAGQSSYFLPAAAPVGAP